MFRSSMKGSAISVVLAKGAVCTVPSKYPRKNPGSLSTKTGAGVADSVLGFALQEPFNSGTGTIGTR
jgi:hypothetical protein